MTFWASLSGIKITVHNKLSWGREWGLGWGGGGGGGWRGDIPADGEVSDVGFSHVNVENDCIFELFFLPFSRYLSRSACPT